MIKRLRVQNFKSLRDVDVTLEPVTVFIGRSGSGKSNLIYGLRFLRDLLVTRNKDQEMWRWMGGWHRYLSATASDDKKITITVDFDVPRSEGLFVYHVAVGRPQLGAGLLIHEERLESAGQVIFHHAQNKWMKQPPMTEVPQPNDGLLLGTLYGVPQASSAYIMLAKGIGCYDFSGDVLASGKFDTSKGTGLEDDAGNYLAAFDGIISDLSQLDSIKEILMALQWLNPAIIDVAPSIDRNSVKVGHQVADHSSLAFDLGQESEGFRRFMAHLLAVYQQPRKQVLAFEEPEKGIFPAALAVLAQYFTAAAKNRGTQVLLTTHSPELLKHFSAPSIRVVEMHGYETKVGPLEPEQRQILEEQLMSADELLTVDQPRLDPAFR